MPTQSPEPTPTPTQTVTEVNFSNVSLNIVCDIPVLTPTPTLTQTPTPTETITQTPGFTQTPTQQNASAFIIKIKTNNVDESSSGSNQFSLPLFSSQEYDFSINWGDGSPDENYSGSFSSITHTYSNEGEYNVSIVENSVGGFGRIYFNNSGDKLKLLEIVQWGGNTWSNFASAFYGCSNMVITASDGADAKTDNVSFFTSAWRACSSMTSFPSFKMNYATNLTFAWRDCSSLIAVGNLNVNSVVTFTSSWQQCSSIINFPALDMRSMAYGSNCFAGVTLPTASYTAILNNLAQNNNNTNVTFGAGSSKYSASAQASKEI